MRLSSENHDLRIIAEQQLVWLSWSNAMGLRQPRATQPFLALRLAQLALSPNPIRGFWGFRASGVKSQKYKKVDEARTPSTFVELCRASRDYFVIVTSPESDVPGIAPDHSAHAWAVKSVAVPFATR